MSNQGERVTCGTSLQTTLYYAYLLEKLRRQTSQCRYWRPRNSSSPRCKCIYIWLQASQWSHEHTSTRAHLQSPSTLHTRPYPALRVPGQWEFRINDHAPEPPRPSNGVRCTIVWWVKDSQWPRGSPSWRGKRRSGLLACAVRRGTHPKSCYYKRLLFRLQVLEKYYC